MPSAYQAERAQTSLNEIPGDPPEPQARNTPAPELPRQAIKRMEEARRLFTEQRYSEAAIEADKALRYNTENIEACRLAALACMLSGNDKQARAYADAGIELRPNDLVCHYIRGRGAQKAEQYELALTEYRTALKCPAAQGSADHLTLTQHHLGLMLHGMGFYQAAVQQLAAFEVVARALGGKESANPELAGIIRTNRGALLNALAESHEVLREYSQAADVLSQAVKLGGDDANLRTRYIKDLVRARRLDEACAQVSSFASSGEADLGAARLLIDVYQVAGHPERGLAALKRVAADHPDKVDVGLLYAEALASAKQYAQAVRVLDDLVARHPKQATAARWKLISIHRLQGNRKDWLWALAGQLASDPADTHSAREELAQLPDAEAGRLLDEVLKQSPAVTGSAPADNTRAVVMAARYCCLGWLADRLNRVEAAQALFDRASRADAGFTPALVGVAELWMHRCKWDKALAVLKETKSDDPARQVQVSRLMGRCYDGLDDDTSAIESYRKAIELKHDDTETMLLLGKLLDRANRAKEAQSVYTQIIAADPEMLEARERLILNLINHWNEGDNLKRMLANAQGLGGESTGQPGSGADNGSRAAAHAATDRSGRIRADAARSGRRQPRRCDFATSAGNRLLSHARSRRGFEASQGTAQAVPGGCGR